MRELGALRHEPTDKRIRGMLGDHKTIDSTRALLVWEPKRVVPTYAVPEQDIDGELVAAPADAVDTEGVGVPEMGAPRLEGRIVFDPSVPFAVRTTDGEPLTIRTPGGREAAAFRPADDALAGYVIVDFDAFDAWYEEDERNVGHPRDPFHRIDIVHSRRHVRVEHEGELSRSPPIRTCCSNRRSGALLPAAEDVRTDLLAPSDTRTFCAYKGEASYWSLASAEDVAWCYPQPLREAAEVTDRIAFFNEHVDVVVDGTPLERPETPWSRR